MTATHTAAREESQNHSGWKRPLRSSSPTIHPAPPCLLNHVPRCHIHTVFEPLQRWGLHHLPGQPGPTSDRSFSEKTFPNIQSEPPLAQLEAIKVSFFTIISAASFFAEGEFARGLETATSCSSQLTTSCSPEQHPEGRSSLSRSLRASPGEVNGLGC